MFVNFHSSKDFKNITLAWSKKSKRIKVSSLREAIASVAGFSDLKSYLKHLDSGKPPQQKKEVKEEKLYVNQEPYENSNVFEHCLTIQVSRPIKDVSAVQSIPTQFECKNHPANEALVLISEVLGCNLKEIKKLNIEDFAVGDELPNPETYFWSDLYMDEVTDERGYAVEILGFEKEDYRYTLTFNLDISTNLYTYGGFDCDPIIVKVMKNLRVRLGDYELFEFILRYLTDYLTKKLPPFIKDTDKGPFFHESLEREFNYMFFDEMVPNMPTMALNKYTSVDYLKSSGLANDVAYMYHLTNSLLYKMVKHPKNNINLFLTVLEAVDCLPDDFGSGENIMFSHIRGELIQ